MKLSALAKALEEARECLLRASRGFRITEEYLEIDDEASVMRLCDAQVDLENAIAQYVAAQDRWVGAKM